MPEGVHPGRHQRGSDPRAARDLLRVLIDGAGLIDVAALVDVAVLVAVAALVAAAVLGCDLGPPGRDDASAPAVLASSPADGARGVPRLGPFSAELDRPLLPRSVNRGTVRVESGDVRAFLAVDLDPVRRSIVAFPFDGEPLAEEVTYRFVIDGVRDLEDRALAEPFVAAFRTGSALGTLPTVARAGYAEVQPILSARCAGAGCHGPGDPALGLDLSSAEGIVATARGAPSRQLPSGTAGPEGARGALALAGLPILDVLAGQGAPATSYLVYKVLGDAHVVGEAMPPPSAGGPLARAEAEALSAWIRAGAPTD